MNCVSEVCFFQIGPVENGPAEIRTLKTHLLQFGLGEVYLEKSAVPELGFFKLEVEKIGIVQLTVVKRKFHQKGICGVKMNPKDFTSLKSDILETNFENLCIAQVTVTEGAIFEV